MKPNRVITDTMLIVLGTVYAIVGFLFLLRGLPGWGGYLGGVFLVWMLLDERGQS